MGMRHDAPHLGPCALDEYQVVRNAGAKERPRRRQQALQAMAEIACGQTSETLHVDQGAARLVAKNGAPPLAAIRIQEICGHRAKCSSTRDVGPNSLHSQSGSHECSFL